MKARFKIILNCTLGSDPEVFIQNQEGKIIGSEHVIGKRGLTKKNPYDEDDRVVVDGVQAELHPSPSTCRQTLSNNIRSCFTVLKERMDKKGCSLSTSGVVKVDKKELEKLSEEAQQLGCAPSLNTYDSHAKINVDPKKYLIRSAGGHIHLGVTDNISAWKAGHKSQEHPFTPENAVPLLDLFVGNTCVLIDRDPAQAERRKVYGRAGEYRLPKHGLEYRTPSNFWIRHYTLMSLVMNLARIPVTLLLSPHSSYCEHPEIMVKWLQENTNFEEVRKAINTNDYDLALKNHEVVEEFTKLFIPTDKEQARGHNVPLWPEMLDWFRYWVSKPMEHWFPKEPVEYWMNHRYDINHGWETYVTLSAGEDQWLKEKKKNEKKAVHA